MDSDWLGIPVPLDICQLDSALKTSRAAEIQALSRPMMSTMLRRARLGRDGNPFRKKFPPTVDGWWLATLFILPYIGNNHPS